MFNELSERVPDQRYRGMNPAFVKRVWKKRREQEALKAAEKQEELRHQNVLEVSAEPATGDIKTHFRVITISEKQPKLSGQDIIRQVCDAYDMDVDVVLGASRYRGVVDVRQQAMAAVYQMRPDLSFPQIGRLFNRDHTTVIHAVMKLGVHVCQTGGRRLSAHPDDQVSEAA